MFSFSTSVLAAFRPDGRQLNLAWRWKGDASRDDDDVAVYLEHEVLASSDAAALYRSLVDSSLNFLFSARAGMTLEYRASTCSHLAPTGRCVPPAPVLHCPGGRSDTPGIRSTHRSTLADSSRSRWRGDSSSRSYERDRE